MAQQGGQQILRGLSEMREFFRQVSLLLRTAEDLLYEKGWRDMFNSAKSCDLTSDLGQPGKWMPRDIYRLYITTEDDSRYRDIIVYLSVHLDQEGAWKGFKEPWISCGVCKFLADRRPDKVRPSDYIRAHLENEHDPDGVFWIYSHEAGEEWYDDVGITYEASMALPLVEIRSSEELKQKIMQPLSTQIEEATENHKS